METKKAFFIREVEGWRGRVNLYRLDPPLVREPQYEDDEYSGTFEYVLVSAVIAPFSGAETLVFPATEDGEAVHMLDIAGLGGTLSHSEVIKDMGYEEVTK